MLSRFNFGPVLIVKQRGGADIAHEFAMDQGRGVGKDGGITEEPGFDLVLIVSIGSVKTRIVHEERGDFGTVEIVDERFRQLLVQSLARDAGAIDGNRAALFGNNVPEVRLIAHHEGHVAVVRLRDPGIPGGEMPTKPPAK